MEHNTAENNHLPRKPMRLRISHSFEDANAADAGAVLKQLPLERIRETVQLILRTYSVTEEQLKERRKKFHLKIIRYE